MSNSQLKPWLNEDGSFKSGDEFRRIAHFLRPGVWNEYLAALAESEREDHDLSPLMVDTFTAEECAKLLFAVAAEEKYSCFKIALKSCVRELPPRQRNVIAARYEGDKTIAEIAADMGISRQAVFKSLKIAMSKLKDSLTSGTIQRRVIALKELLPLTLTKG